MKKLEPLARPPGVLVPSFYIDPETKVFGCYARPWEDILVEEIEERMRLRANRNGDSFSDVWKREYLGQFKIVDYKDMLPGIPGYSHYAKKDADLTRRCFDALRRKSPNFAMNRPSPRLRGVQADEIIIDSLNYADIELRTLSTIPKDTLAMLGARLRRHQEPNTGRNMHTNERTTSPVADLSSFAAAVARLRSEGLRDPEIARKLGVEKATLDKRMKDHRRQERRRG